ncbi:MAG: molybdate ABC transporter substrate-binding protein [Cyanobacteriota bacterium]|nr:molybdate ABC transporter substrate-binding protein [Cyanobacteriota bacterium]
MNRRRILALTCSFFLSLLLTIGCSRPQSTEPQANSATLVSSSEQTELTVSAAASLTDAMEAIQPLYEQEYPNVKLIYNFASSGSLQQQIEQGAPVDVFISAAPKQMNALEEKGLIMNETRKDLLKNQMVLIVREENDSVNSFEDLITNKVTKIAVGEPESVPAGKYAQEVLISLNLLKSVQPKEVYTKTVRQVLSYVETGNVEAGIVYSSDAKISDQVKIVTTASTENHSPILYPAAVTKDSNHQEVAEEFIQFLSSDPAKSVFEKYGFGLIN